MQEKLLAALAEAASERSEGGRTYGCLSLEAVSSLASRFNLPISELSALALENGFLPLRYVKNIGTIGLDGQAKLLRSAAVVVGVGGIGGNAAEMLARLGFGKLTLIDPDTFDETNLNRQNFSCRDVVGMAKVEVVRDRILEISGGADVATYRVAAESDNLPRLIDGADVVIDALDSLSDRHVLQRACAEMGVVMVHGAIAGTALQVTTIYPGDPGLVSFAPLPESEEHKVRGIELETGNPPTTPALAAAIQVIEAVKMITGIGTTLRGKMLYMDVLDWTLDFIDLSEG